MRLLSAVHSLWRKCVLQESVFVWMPIRCTYCHDPHVHRPVPHWAEVPASSVAPFPYRACPSEIPQPHNDIHLHCSERAFMPWSPISPFTRSHLGLNLLEHLLQVRLLHLLRRPSHPKSICLIRFRYHMKMHMIDHLVRDASVVLQYVVVCTADCFGDVLGNGKDLC